MVSTETVSSPLEILPLDEALGAVVNGVDATADNPPETIESLRQAVAEYGFVLLRDQVLTEDQHVAFAAAFGATEVPWLHAIELNTVARIDELPGQPGYTGAHPGVNYFFNGPKYRDEPDDGYLQGWHADGPHVQIAQHLSLLSMIEAPDEGYETWYSNQYLGYEQLDDAIKQRVDELKIVHHFTHMYPQLPPVVHPVVMKHPISGRRCIYGIPGCTDPYPLGVSPGEGAELMAALQAHLERDACVYKHRWSDGDLLIWDNRCVLHRRGLQIKGQTRIMRRVMAGDGDKHSIRQRLMGQSPTSPNPSSQTPKRQTGS